MNAYDAESQAQLLYSRVPAQYRVYDAERGYPLLALLQVVGEQAANLGQDLYALWDNFFIETCADWVVPYIGSLLGTNLLAHPVGQSNRLDVKNTVLWRRSKGTPAMLRALAAAISGWPADLAEFFQALGWSQNMNHLRLNHPLTACLRDPYPLSLLGRAADPFAHLADFRPAGALDQARVTAGSLGIGRAAWGTPGRYNIKNLGFFVRRLQTFRIQDATPAAAAPGAPLPPDPACFTFDPLFRDAPLFVEASGEPLSRAAFGQAPWQTFGRDVAVRQFGVLLASDAPPAQPLSSSRTPFRIESGATLQATAGLRLMDAHGFPHGAAHFVIQAASHDGGGDTLLGSLSTLHAALGHGNAFIPGAAPAASGTLVVSVQAGRSGLGWPGLPSAPAGRFPGATIALRVAHSGPPRLADGLYIYLPPAFVRPGDVLTYHIADDGSTYSDAALAPASLARASEGSIYPAHPLASATAPADQFIALSRGPGGLRLPDPARFAGEGVLFQVDVFTGSFQTAGAIATADQPAGSYPGLAVPDPWPAFTFGAAKNPPPEDAGAALLSVCIAPLPGAALLPTAELVVANRAGQSLLVYLPELPNADVTSIGPDGVRMFVAEDGSTYYAPVDDVGQLNVFKQHSFVGLKLARASAGQVLPIPGIFPLEQRRPVALDLCRCERNATLGEGQLGIDPERGRFALAPGDPAIAQGGFSVDYVEAFGERVGARTFDRQPDPQLPPTRLVAQTGDARSELNPAVPAGNVHSSLDAALSAAQDGDVIEIVDSATYAGPNTIVFNRPAVRRLTVRAATGQRPYILLTPGGPAGQPVLAIASALDHLELNGLFFSGGPLLIETQVDELWLTACTLDPLTTEASGALIATDADAGHHAAYLVCRCILGGLRLGAGVGRLIAADSIVDAQGGLAIGGLPAPGPGPAPDPAAAAVQIERVTVLGRLRCAVLTASECLLDDLAMVDDQQAGCIRFSRYERGSTLPRRYQCVPADNDPACLAPPCCAPPVRCLAPLYNSRRFGRPDYAQLAAACPPAILSASEAGAEPGAFASALNTVRLGNLNIKVQEFMPAGLSALVIAET